MTESTQAVSQRPRQTQTQAPQTWKLTLAYDGTDFAGWQFSHGNHHTGRGCNRPRSRGATRARMSPDDAGMHALAQCQPLHARIPPANLLRALNRTLPRVHCLEAQIVPGTFPPPYLPSPKPTSTAFSPSNPPAIKYARRFSRAMSILFVALDLLPSTPSPQHFSANTTSVAATDPDLTTRTLDSAATSAIQTQPRGPQRRSLDRRGGSPHRRHPFTPAWCERTAPTAFHLLIYRRVRGSRFLHHG